MYVSRTQYVRYLQGYSSMLGVDVRLKHTVTSATRPPGPALGSDRWEVTVRIEAEDVEPVEKVYRPRVLVVANGMFNNPTVPEIPGLERFRGQTMHSSNYKNGREFDGKRVLVVGTGNSGCEIVCDLWEHGAKTTVHNRSPAPVLPRWIIALMQQSGYCKPGYGSTLEACEAANPQLYKALYDRTIEWLIRQTFGDVVSAATAGLVAATLTDTVAASRSHTGSSSSKATRCASGRRRTRRRRWTSG